MNHRHAFHSNRAVHIAASGRQMRPRATPAPLRRLTWAVHALCASAARVACGGGDGNSASESTAAATPNSTDVPALIDTSVSTAQALNAAAPGFANATDETRGTAQSVQRESAALSAAAPTSLSVPVPCAVEGQATLTAPKAWKVNTLRVPLDAAPWLACVFSGDAWARMMKGSSGRFSGFPATSGGGHWVNVQRPWKVASDQAMMKVVRAAGARNVVLLGGMQYAQNLSGWLAKRPTDPLNQMGAAWHPLRNWLLIH